MKEFIRKNIKSILLVLITAVICISGTVVASNIFASNIDFTPNDNTWNVNNVSSALNDLYATAKDIDIVYESSMQQATGLLNTAVSTTFTKDYDYVFIVYGTVNTGSVSKPIVNTNIEFTQLNSFEASRWGKNYMVLSVAENVKIDDYITLTPLNDAAGPFMFIVGINKNS